MMDEQGTRFAVLLEDVDRKLGVLAEAVAAQAADSKALKSSFEGLDSRFGEMTFEMRELKKTVSQVATKVDRLDAFATDAAPRLERLEGKVDRLDAFATDAAPRLERLEGKVDRLDVFATDAAPRLERLEAFAMDAAPRLERLEAFAMDAAPRLERIESHLALARPLPRREPPRRAPSKHHRRKPTKRT